MSLIFRRARSEQFAAGFTVIPLDGDLARLYREGAYQEFFLSSAGVPTHERDWSFTTTAMSGLLQFSGGRMERTVLEECVARPVAKDTLVKRPFEQLRKALNKVCRRGLREKKTGTVYRNLYWEPKVFELGLELRTQLDYEGIVYGPMDA